ncbi:MAG: hypothetical protein LUG99_10020 [Lachnospiraceae bacterium]|nr:hypothetical protein [Lachnospiraceae bacterium]
MKLKLIKSKLWKKDDALAYFIILAVFVAMSSSELAVAQSAQLSLFEYVLYALADHYYLIYGWLFFLVFVTGKEVRNHADSEIIRYGSFSRYHFVTLTAAAIRLALLIAVHILIAAIIGSFSLAPVNVFTVSEASSYYSGDFLDLLAGYQHYFGNPVTALLGAAGYLWLGSLFLYAVIFLASQSWGSKGMLTACVIIIVSAIVGFVSHFDESALEFLFANNYYILHHALLLVSPLAVAVNLAVMGVFLLAGTNDLPRRIRRKKRIQFRETGKNRSAFFSPAPRRGLVPLYLVLLIALGVFPQLSSGGSLADFAWSLLRGYSAESVNLIELLYTLAWFAFPLIQISVFWQAERERKNDAALLRTGSFRRWRTLTDRGCVRFILRYWLWYVTLLASMMAALYFLYGYGAESAAEYYTYFGVSETNFIAALLAAVLLKLPELLLMYELSLALYSLFGNTVLSFFVPFLGYGVGLLLPFRWYPFGISSAYQLLRLISGGWSGYAAAVLCMAGILVALKLFNIARRKNR